ncbi:hypothetical protein [Sphingobium sp.]
MAAQNDPLHDMTCNATTLLQIGRFLPLQRYDASNFAATRAAAITQFLKD